MVAVAVAVGDDNEWWFVVISGDGGRRIFLNVHE